MSLQIMIAAGYVIKEMAVVYSDMDEVDWSEQKQVKYFNVTVYSIVHFFSQVLLTSQ